MCALLRGAEAATQGKRVDELGRDVAVVERESAAAERCRLGSVGGGVIAIEVWQDAIELARAASGRVNKRTILRAVLSNDSFRITTLFRVREWARRWHVPLVNHALRVAQTSIFGIELGNDVTLGHGVYFIHPCAVVIGGDAVIGNRVRFMGSNTVGTAKDNGYPVIDDDVTVGAGARIIGPVRIGAGAHIGANAVVTKDVPANHIAVGIPARVYPQKGNRGEHNDSRSNVKELFV